MLMKRFLSERNLVIVLFFLTLAIFVLANYDTKIREENLHAGQDKQTELSENNINYELQSTNYARQ